MKGDCCVPVRVKSASGAHAPVRLVATESQNHLSVRGDGVRGCNQENQHDDDALHFYLKKISCRPPCERYEKQTGGAQEVIADAVLQYVFHYKM